MNLVLNAIKSQRRYNNKRETLLLRSLVRVLCHLGNTAVGFLKTMVADAGSRVDQYGSLCAAKAPTLELQKFLKMWF